MKVINAFSGLSLYVAAAFIIGMMLLTVSDVFMRYLFSSPITGATELIEYMMIGTLLSMASCALENRHVKVEGVVQYLPPWARMGLEIITLIVSFIFIGILAWQGYQAGVEELSYGVSSSMLRIPHFPFYIVLAAGFTLLCLAILNSIFLKVLEPFKHES